jgi:hypothetical protein
VLDEPPADSAPHRSGRDYGNSGDHLPLLPKKNVADAGAVLEGRSLVLGVTGTTSARGQRYR